MYIYMDTLITLQATFSTKQWLWLVRGCNNIITEVWGQVAAQTCTCIYMYMFLHVSLQKGCSFLSEASLQVLQ